MVEYTKALHTLKVESATLNTNKKPDKISWTSWILYLIKHDDEEEIPVGPETQFEKLVAPSADSHKFEFIPPGQLAVFSLHYLAGYYGAYVCLTSAKIPTIIFTLFLVYLCMMGLLAGVHRLWTHRSYKAKPQLEALLVFCYLLNNQWPIKKWVKNHRLHHMCSDTDADPHNAARGFLFSHIGWMFVKPHPEVVKRLKYIDMSDVRNNPILRFQEKYIIPLLILIPYILPSMIALLWGESFFVAHTVNYFRLLLTLNIVSLVNSATHLMGYKPIDKTVAGTQFGFAGAVCFGEGFHNYHHTFPQDYRASELGDTKYNLTTQFIHFFQKIGWAYDLKTTSDDIIRNRVLKKGDGTDQYYIPCNAGKQKFFSFKFYKGT